MKDQKIIPEQVVGRLLQIVIGLVLLYVLLDYLGVHRLFAEDSEEIGIILGIIGTLYSVLYAFAIYVTWGQFTAVEDHVRKEAGALKDLVLFSRSLKANAREDLVRAVRSYAQGVLDGEWTALSRKQSTEKTDREFSEIVSAVTALKPENEDERLAVARLLEIAHEASGHRDARLAVSATRIPRTLLFFVTLTASMIPLLLFLYPAHNPVLGAIAIVVTTTLLYLAHFVVTDLDNPFEGTWNAGPEPFGELFSKAR